MKKIKVRSTSGGYEIWCGRGIAAQSTRAVARLAKQGEIFLISSPRVWKHMGARIEKIFKGVHCATILFDDQEAAKNLSTVERASRQLVRVGADRRALLVAVGGGVVGDVAGFVAASYARGIGLVHIPTTLVAQVDSAVGGKTGVIFRKGKTWSERFIPRNW
jgi:3-dehydroquinate synthetase